MYLALDYDDTYHHSRTMAQVSRRLISQEVWERIFNLFLETFVHIRKKDQLQSFVTEFLTPTERIMLAKRLAIAVLLTKGHDYRSIANLVRVTPSTIARVNVFLKYEGKGFNSVIQDIFKRQAIQIIWEEIKGIIDVPPGSELKRPWLRKVQVAREQKIERIKKEF